MLKCGTFLLFGAAVCLLGLTGCETTRDSAGENLVRVAHTVDTNGKEIPDDTEELLLLDRPMRLSSQPVPLR